MTQDGKELRARVKSLQSLPAWYDPLVDQLIREILAQDRKIEQLEKRISDYGWAEEASRQQWMESERERCSWK